MWPRGTEFNYWFGAPSAIPYCCQTSAANFIKMGFAKLITVCDEGQNVHARCDKWHQVTNLFFHLHLSFSHQQAKKLSYKTAKQISLSKNCLQLFWGASLIVISLTLFPSKHPYKIRKRKKGKNHPTSVEAHGSLS